MSLAIRTIATKTAKPMIVHPPLRWDRSLLRRASQRIQAGPTINSLSERILVEGARKMTREPNAIMNAGKYKLSVENVSNHPIHFTYHPRSESLHSIRPCHHAVAKAATSATSETQHICDTPMPALESGRAALAQLQAR